MVLLGYYFVEFSNFPADSVDGNLHKLISPTQPQLQPSRKCHIHLGGGANGANPLGKLDAEEVTSADMLRAMMAYIWPKDDALVRKRYALKLLLTCFITHFLIL